MNFLVRYSAFRVFIVKAAIEAKTTKKYRVDYYYYYYYYHYKKIYPRIAHQCVYSSQLGVTIYDY